MTEPFLPYGRQFIDDDDVAAVEAVLRGDWLTTGPAVEEFESTLAGIAGAPAVSVTSGTAALHVAYAALGVGAGSEVVTSPMTFVATASTAALLGADVRFADVDDATLNLDPAAAADAVTSRTRAITVVDYAGNPADVDAVRTVIGDRDIAVVQDAAHSLGAAIGDRPVGSVADVTTFSFFPTKTVTTGEGGAVVTPDPGVLQRARSFRNHGLVRDRAQMRTPDEGGWHQEVHAFGLNYRLPDVLAALGTSQLRKLPGFLRRRDEIVARYGRELADVEGLRLPAARDGVTAAWHLYAVRVLDGRRRELYDTLRAAGIGVQVNYYPAHLHPVFRDLGYGPGRFPVAERAYSELLSLPLFPAMTDDDQSRVIDAVRAALRG